MSYRDSLQLHVSKAVIRNVSYQIEIQVQILQALNLGEGLHGDSSQSVVAENKILYLGKVPEAACRHAFDLIFTQIQICEGVEGLESVILNT